LTPNIAVPPRATPGNLTMIFSVLLGGLAAGALWCLLSLSIDRGVGALIVPLAFGIGIYFHWLGLTRVRGAICAIAAIVIAFVYAQYLFAAVRVAQTLGFPLRSTLFQMDLGLAWQVTRGNLGMLDFVFLAVACAIAAAFTLRRR
jgi:hypothetical protein